jgi:hypothetical protein
MDYLKTIRSIIDSLNKAGYKHEATRIEVLRDGASVGSELLMSVTHELLEFIKANDKLNESIGSDVIELKKFCWSIGLQIDNVLSTKFRQ